MGLDKLLYLQGVAIEFNDCNGEYVRISDADRLGVLTCMLTQVDANQPDSLSTATELLQSEESIAKRNFQLDAMPWTQALPPFQHCNIEQLTLDFYLPDNLQQQVEIKLQLESGECYQFAINASHHSHCRVVGDYRIDAQIYLHYQLQISADVCGSELPHIGFGYHQVSISGYSKESTDKQISGTWLVAPSKTYQRVLPNQQATKEWGISVQLYSLRSENQWGIGDFGDLLQLIDLAATQKAAFILLNPLHALSISTPEEASPYSPDDRRRLNPLYINLEQVAEFNDIDLPQLLSSLSKFDGILSQLENSDLEAIDSLSALKKLLNQSDWLNYTEVSFCKYHVLQQLYLQFCLKQLNCNSQRAQQFKDFIAEQGEPLTQFCLQQVKASANLNSFDNPPAEFFAYLQFVAEQQLAKCQLHAKQQQMSIGLVRDLAVGVSASGSEVASHPELFCTHASIGAPPDRFAPQGQNWGLVPLDPIALKQHSYQYFINLLRRNMQSCGALRIDHVMSLLRLWWWPNNPELGGGAYVYYPLDSLMAILCIESQRARCRIIGEDLGIIPAEIVTCLESAGVLSNQLFYFNKQQQQFTEPKQYKPHCLMMLANHDVPTLAAWWTGADLTLRRSLELIADEQTLSQLQAERAEDKQQLLNLVIAHNQLDATSTLDNVDYQALLSAWIQVCATGKAELFSVQLCDLIQERLSVNVPGTWHEYPNWQRRLPKTLTQIINDDEVKLLMQQLAASRAEVDR
ncbi:4-alpha-glucanotransferase [Shewanella sp. 1CM18E]|uniref:4-alpha-glucanotransferase n=1 Tax=Shewanella sp. 1CM18E TaxID=2929169 RepID=UPI0020C12C80|nr:4-alpha-glucanotransferase [Shewanella sp. 1CM18E]MCK8043549.1 4-alpha-glucanotransferase [Shewanella sp. 1CM18E]